MFAIVDIRIPEQAKIKLAKEFELIEFYSEGITYDAISGHPDIFLCIADQLLFVAPNTPKHFVEVLEKNKINFTFGIKEVGMQYPATAAYNAVCWNNLLIHNLAHTDETILMKFDPAYRVQINQGYTRCNVLPLKKSLITSDSALSKKMNELGYETQFILPDGIVLPGFEHGFIGGCCGVIENKVYIIGNMMLQNNWQLALKYMEDRQVEVVSLYDGPLFDGGSILFV